MIEWSLQAAGSADLIGPLIVVAPSGAEGAAERALDAAAAGQPARVVAGGATRAESVRAGLEAVSTEFVLVHDAARPVVPTTLFDAIAARLSDSGAEAVIAAAPVTDTVKRAEPGPDGGERVLATLDRSDLWAAQTPQGFRTEALLAAQSAATEGGYLEQATDEAGLIERAGGAVLLEPAPATNLKVTTGDDLALAGALLAAAGRV